MSAPVWPRVILGGAPKCGTTALHAQLEASGAFDVLGRKELFVLNDPDFWMAPPQGGFSAHGLGCYARLGMGSSPFVDGSTTYLYQETAVRACAEAHRAGMPFLVVFVLRDPVERVASNYRYFRHVLQHDVGADSLEDYAEQLLDGSVATGNQQVDRALEHGRYARYLRSWYDRLPSERVLVVDAEAVRCDASAVVDEVLARVGLTSAATRATGITSTANPSYVPRWPRVQRAVLGIGSLVPHGRLRRLGGALYHGAMSHLAGADSDVLSPKTRDRLAEALVDDVRDLNSLVPGADGWHWVTRFPGRAARG